MPQSEFLNVHLYMDIGLTNSAIQTARQVKNIYGNSNVAAEAQKMQTFLEEAQAAAKAAPDGYTFLLATVGEYTITPHMYSKLSFNVSKDLAPVLFATDTPLIFAANASAGFNNIKEMIRQQKMMAEERKEMVSYNLIRV